MKEVAKGQDNAKNKTAKQTRTEFRYRDKRALVHPEDSAGKRKRQNSAARGTKWTL